MEKINHWLNPLAIVAATSIVWTIPTLANEANLATKSDYFQGRESIELYVPPPETGNFQNPRGSNGVCPALEPAIDRLISKNPSKWGILVESLQDRRMLYSHNADKYFIPASNNKIFTTAAALQRLSPEASIRSTSLRNWILITNQKSNNNYADTLMRYIGGPGAAKAALTKLGVDPKSFRLADGSGLSRQNIATPRALVETLRAIYFAPGKEIFYASLPVAGVSGTLKNRMRQTAAEGMVYAKTGTLTGVRALSGYMYHSVYGMLVFSMIGNNQSQSGDSLVKIIDNIVLQLRTLPACD